MTKPNHNIALAVMLLLVLMTLCGYLTAQQFNAFEERIERLEAEVRQ